VDYAEGGVVEVLAHDGSVIKLRKLHPDYEPTDKVGAQTAIARAAQKGEVLTGLLYLAADAKDLHEHLNTYASRPFNRLAERELCPGSTILEKINAGLR
jgi:2-oxoglutarate ferredoxin oxidoreductase subunit beta